MGKLTRNKVAPKDSKTLKDNWVKGKDQSFNKTPKSGRRSFFKKPDEPVKLARVKDDPFFVSESTSEEKPSGSNLNNTWSSKSTKKTPPQTDRRRSLSSWKSKTNFFQKNKNEPAATSPKTGTKQNIESKKEHLTPKVDQKKPFDKKKWRMQKYSKRLKLDQWEEKRKKAILRNYFKDTKDTTKKFENPSSDEEGNDEMDVDNENNLNANIQSERELSNKSVEFVEEEEEEQLNSSKARKGKAYKKAKLEYERIKNEKKQRKEELARRKKERDEALKIYKEKKVEKFKKLNRRTKKGQPIMKDQIEMLLEKIQKNVGQ